MATQKFIASWDKKYLEKEYVFGEIPDYALIRYPSIIPIGKALDMGVGEGRNALYLARQGLSVHGIDISQTAINKCIKAAEKEKLSVTAAAMSIENFEIETTGYDLILSTMTLHTLKLSDSLEIIEKMKEGVKPGGLIYISVLGIGDSGYHKDKSQWKEVEGNTFYNEEKEFYSHYFKKDELMNPFADWKLIFSGETESLRMGKEGKPLAYQNTIFYMGKKISL